MHSVEILHRDNKELPQTLIHWFMREYLSDYSIDLTVVHMDLSDEGVDGWCMREDDIEFIIQIDENLTDDEYRRTLLHEMYHMYQHLKRISRCEMCAYGSEQQNLDKFSNSL
jgi:Zn-dependent peptidase ImmA (M78 family)